ncbi:MAG: AAA family ATPase [Lachnospiraceae bacterium]|nr:AAA family ATPase [Lachnospiraceae bacterium]
MNAVRIGCMLSDVDYDEVQNDDDRMQDVKGLGEEFIKYFMRVTEENEQPAIGDREPEDEGRHNILYMKRPELNAEGELTEKLLMDRNDNNVCVWARYIRGVVEGYSENHNQNLVDLKLLDHKNHEIEYHGHVFRYKRLRNRMVERIERGDVIGYQYENGPGFQPGDIVEVIVGIKEKEMYEDGEYRIQDTPDGPDLVCYQPILVSRAGQESGLQDQETENQEAGLRNREIENQEAGLRNREIENHQESDYQEEGAGWDSLNGGNVEELITQLYEKTGYQLRDHKRILAGFLMALGTNQLIILHGKPGSGKSSFTEAAAKLMNAEYRRISVRPNWIDNQDLMGFYNPVEMMYYPTEFLDVLMEAGNHPSKRYIVCMDEMNLAYIEQYFSDILSAMESKERLITLYSEQEERRRKNYIDSLRFLDQYDYTPSEDEITNQNLDMEKITLMEKKNHRLSLKENAKHYPAVFVLPENIQFVGTLNMDATTKELSPKVIDRSFLIDFDGADCDIQGTPVTPDEVISWDDIDLYRLLHVKASRRSEKQLADLVKHSRNSGMINSISRNAFYDILVMSKLLPSVRLHTVYYTSEEAAPEPAMPNMDLNLRSIISEHKDTYPGTVEKLKKMYVEENSSDHTGSLNYWRNI